MILLPIGHEDARYRRVPWVTFGIMISCFLAFLASGRAHPLAMQDERLEREVVRALRYWSEHRYLDLDESFRDRVFGGQDEAQVAAQLDALSGDGDGGSTGVEGPAAQQRRLDALVERALKEMDSNAVLSWGLVPQQREPLTLLTHMFLHAGWLHLIGNMLMLFVAGPLIEDLWGRLVFALFYITGGLVAAFSHIGVDPASTVPMIGASGAIAAVMGAFLVRAGATKIRFFYLIAACGGTFSMPAWIMLPVWLVSQLILAALTHESGAGVAYWAHIGGFVAGAGFAVALAAVRAEERWLRPAIDRRVDTTIIDNASVDAALATRAAGRHEDAFEQLRRATLDRPDSIDSVAALREMAAEQDRFAEAAPAMVAALRVHLRRGDHGLALDLWTELLREVPDVRVESSVLIRLGQALAARQERDACRQTLLLAIRAAKGRLTPAAAMRIARAARFVDATLARQAVAYALSRPDIDADTRNQAEQLESELSSLPALV